MSVAHLPKRARGVRSFQNTLNILVAAIIGVAIVGGLGGLVLCRLGVVCKAADSVDLTTIRTQVRYRPSGGDEIPLPASKPQPIAKGDAVAVDLGGEATLRFSDFLTVRIFHGSNISIEADVDQNAAPIYHYRLESGTTFNALNPDSAAKRRVRVSTSWAVIEDLGTEFMAYVDPKTETTWVIVRQGKAQVTAQGKSVDVPAGMQTWVEPQQPPVPPIPASRPAIGMFFPQVDELTNGAIADREVLTQEVASTDTPTPSATPTITATAALSATAVVPTDTPTMPVAVEQGGGLNVPAPRLSVRGVDLKSVDSIYSFSVDNWADFPTALFAKAPYLGQPLCVEYGYARIIVEFYDQDGNEFWESCGYSSPQDIAEIRFPYKQDQTPPREVYIVLHDWVANKFYRSNTVLIPSDIPTITPTPSVTPTLTPTTGPLPAPVQVAPANGAPLNYSDMATLQWSAVDGAASYAVEIECGTTACTAGQSFSNIAGTTYTFDPFTFFGGPMVMRWRVWAVDTAGNPGAQSGWWVINFTATPTPEPPTPTPTPLSATPMLFTPIPTPPSVTPVLFTPIPTPPSVTPTDTPTEVPTNTPTEVPPTDTPTEVPPAV